MSTLNIAVVVGSIRKDSYNRQFAEALARQFPAGVTATFIRIDDLPLYCQDDDANPPAPAVARLRQEIKAADGVLFVTPEYNRSMPGVLKNAIDHASRPWGQSVWAGNVLSYLAMPQLGQPEMFIQWKDGLVEGGRIGAASQAFVQKFVDAFVGWVRRQAG